MSGRRSVVTKEDIETVPLTQWESDLGLKYADENYEEEIDPDLLRIVFDTIQYRRTPHVQLHELVRVVVDELIRESHHKRVAMRAVIGKINNNRRQMKEGSTSAIYAPSKGTEYPTDPDNKKQFTMMGKFIGTAK